jgi:hypothetical protein
MADAVITPSDDDCFFFACNAGSQCVPAVALTAGELGNVPTQRRVPDGQTGFGTDAAASDGKPVFVSWCKTTTVGAGAPTERARSEADKSVTLTPTNTTLSSRYALVREVKEEISFEPATDYPPTRVRVSLRVREGGVFQASLANAARHAVQREAGADWNIVQPTWHLDTTPKPDEFAVGYVVRATVTIDKARARQRLVAAIGNLSPRAARATVLRLFPTAVVHVNTAPDKRLPNQHRLKVTIRTERRGASATFVL